MRALGKKKKRECGIIPIQKKKKKGEKDWLLSEKAIQFPNPDLQEEKGKGGEQKRMKKKTAR